MEGFFLGLANSTACLATGLNLWVGKNYILKDEQAVRVRIKNPRIHWN